MRPALEDALGAGAILSAARPRSPEAEAAVAIFERCRDNLLMTLDACSPAASSFDGGGHRDDKFIAAELDASAARRGSMIGFVDAR